MLHFTRLSTIRFCFACISIAISSQLSSQCGPTPIVHNGFAISLPPSGSVAVDAQLFDAGSIDGCASGGLTFSYSSDPNDTFRTFDCNDSPSILVDIWVTDINGNQNFVNTYAILQNLPAECPPSNGSCGPVAIAYNGLSIDISAGPVTLNATDFDAGSLDLCNTGSLTYEIGFSANGFFDHALIIDCNSGLFPLIYLRVTDDLGNQSIVETYLIINDILDYCGGNSPITPCGPAPILMNGLAVALPPSGTIDLPTSSVFLGFVDGCNNGNIQTTITSDGNGFDFGNTSIPLDCSDAGTALLIEGYIQDAAGSITFSTTYVLIQDNLKPQIACIGSGLAIELQPPGFTSTFAGDYVASLVENCDVQFSFSTDPNDNSRIFSCLDLGVQPLTIWATDGSGNQSSCQSEVTILGNMADCDICTSDQYDLGGVIDPDYYRASDYINASGEIDQIVIFQAANSITLLPGFSAPAGTSFNALIAPCTPPLPSPFIESQPIPAQPRRELKVQVFPNPFRSQSKIQIEIPAPGPLKVYVTDQSGRTVTALADLELFQDVFWEGSLEESLPAGLYFLHVENENDHQIHKMICSR